MDITEENFQTEVLQSDLPILVDFWAEWCAPCKAQGPFVAEIGQKYEGRFKIGKLNVENAQNLAAQYGIMNIPTMLVFKDGKEVERLVGLHPVGALSEVVEKYI